MYYLCLFFIALLILLNKCNSLVSNDKGTETVLKILTCRCILITALPMSVAPKKVQKGTRQWPQVIPAKSNRGFGTCYTIHILLFTETVTLKLFYKQKQPIMTVAFTNCTRSTIMCDPNNEKSAKVWRFYPNKRLLLHPLLYSLCDKLKTT